MEGSSISFSLSPGLTGEFFASGRERGFFLGLRFFGSNFSKRITGVLLIVGFWFEIGVVLLTGAFLDSVSVLVEIPPVGLGAAFSSIEETLRAPVEGVPGIPSLFERIHLDERFKTIS